VFGFASQSSWVYVVIAVILAALALSMFGVYELQPPSFLTSRAQARTGVVGALLMGVMVGVVAAPCSGPVVLGLVSFAAANGNPAVGFGLFLTLALGLGFPFLILGWFTGLAAALPKSGAWTEMTKRVFGVLMMGAAVYFLGQALPRGVAAALRAGYLVGAGVYLLVGDHELAAFRGIRNFKSALGAIAAAIGVFLLVGVGQQQGTAGVAWQPVSQEGLQQAERAGQPVVLDFGAEWCQQCEELEKYTFSDTRVEQALTDIPHFKVDLTEDPPSGGFLDQLRQKFGVSGLPVVVFLAPDGQELADLRLTTFERPEAFLDRVTRFKAAAGRQASR
jgi:thiol:disulfide interchange protein DsbD